jgi:hypothetical protein
MIPNDPQAQSHGQAIATDSPQEPARVYHWYHKMSAVIFITFCLEIGLFLLIFPWTDYWPSNYFSTAIPLWSNYWDNMYVRGAISGLGVVNLYISFLEIFRLRRFARR